MVSLIRSNLVDLPVNVSLSYFWCGGFMLSFFLVLQTFTGVILSFLYVADSVLSFACVLEFTQDSFASWVIRYSHVWGVTMIFFLVYIHIGRSLYYSSYSKFSTWNVGFILYLMMMAEAFLGYILPWHQMSYWAATVITSIVQSIPVIGPSLFKYIVGGFGVTNTTLVRVFSAHICLAFVILGLSILHMYYLHTGGSNNPLFISTSYSDSLLFHSYYSSKDFFALAFTINIFFLFILVGPDFFLDSESFIEADPMVTPSSIKPEWYFLSYYAILRSVESKLGGMFLTVAFIFILWLPTLNNSSSYCSFRQSLFWLSISLYLLLTYLGSCHPEYPFVYMSKVGSLGLVISLVFFKFFWVIPYSFYGIHDLFSYSGC